MSYSPPERTEAFYCPVCGAAYLQGGGFCPADGSRLQEGEVDPLVGRVLDRRYQVGEALGRGGMGRVYSGRHAVLGRTVALKILHGDLARDPKMIERFRREAALASSLSHPGVVAIHDFGQTETGLLYLAMEFVEGRTLGDVLKEEPSPSIGRVVDITRQVLSALGHAHEKGVVHRDLKVANILLTNVEGEGERVKIVDFGLAKIVSPIAGSDDSLTQLTQTGVVIGTPHYLSPEQARGEEADPRSDLYAVGVVIYRMLTGRLPIDGANVLEVMSRHLSVAPTPLRDLAPEVPEPLARFVHRLLAKKRDDRYADAQEAHRALAQALAGRPPLWRRPRVIAAAAAGLALAGALLALALGRSAPPAATATAVVGTGAAPAPPAAAAPAASGARPAAPPARPERERPVAPTASEAVRGGKRAVARVRRVVKPHPSRPAPVAPLPRAPGRTPPPISDDATLPVPFR